MQNGSREQIEIARIYKNDLICLLCLTVFVLLIFSGTLFSGKDISRIGTLAHRDTVFGRLAKGIPDPMDTCTYQEHGPNYILTEKIIAAGDLPLWNPYLGFGCPLWADSQVLAFSPITWLQAPFASLRMYNLLIVFHVWLGCLGAYAFARLLKISPPGSLLTSISFGLCPNLLYMFEWNRCQSAFFPMPFVGFALLWRRGDSLSIVACALLCTSMVVSGHAVPSFFAILLASIMYFLLAVCLPKDGAQSRLSGIGPVMFANFLLVALLTLLLSAPFVVPFLEGVRASDTFKATQGYVRYVVRETALLPSLFYPFHGAGSAYSGAVSIILAVSAPLIATRNRKLVLSLSALALLTLCILTRPGPFDLLFQLPYLSWFMVVYALPGLLLLIAVLAGAGFDSIVEEEAILKSFPLIFSVALLAVCMPFVFQSMHLEPRFMQLNDWLKTMEVSSSARIRELVILIVSLILIFAVAKCPAKLRTNLALCLILLNALSLSFIIRKSLPARPAFSYEAVDPIGFLSSQGRRVVSMGRHVLVPNTSQVFSVSNLLSFMPTHPKGVPAFLDAAGISLEGVSQFAEKPLNKLADIGAVKYAVASEPVLSVEDILPEAIDLPVSGGINFGSDLRLLGLGLSVDSGNQDIVGCLKWNQSERKQSPVYLLMLVKPDGALLWLGDRHVVGNKAEKSVITASIPRSLKAGEEVCLILQVIDPSGSKLLAPLNAPSGMKFDPNANSLLLKRFAVPVKEQISARHFRLVSETSPEMVRVYENKSSMPEAYLVSSSRKIASIEATLSEMLKPGFDPRKEALIYEGDALAEDSEPAFSDARVIRPSVNEVLVEAKSDRPSMLVLTDVYFPGWHVLVDGKESRIIRTNAVFRGVRLDPGFHRVRFFFDPSSLKIGLAMFVIGLFVIVFLLRPVAESPRKESKAS